MIRGHLLGGPPAKPNIYIFFKINNMQTDNFFKFVNFCLISIARWQHKTYNTAFYGKTYFVFMYNMLFYGNNSFVFPRSHAFGSALCDSDQLWSATETQNL